ncbi:hypothetical protein, partial [Gelidibacter algens]|uniref:hypothetical protein n=1 Tax=Gelidibacter algens TaxID=49280 RepID=UPI001B80152F
NVYVYELLRVTARAIPNTKLRWKIREDFPDRHRPSNGLYTVLANRFIIFSFGFLSRMYYCYKNLI